MYLYIHINITKKYIQNKLKLSNFHLIKLSNFNLTYIYIYIYIYNIHFYVSDDDDDYYYSSEFRDNLFRIISNKKYSFQVNSQNFQKI